MRVRLTAAAVGALVAVLGLTAVALVLAQRWTLTEALEETLRVRAAELAATAAAGQLPGRLPRGGDDDSVSQVVDAAGDVVAASDNLAGRPPLLPSPAPDTSTLTTVELDGEEVRLLSRSAGDLVVHVGSPLDDVHDSVAALIGGLVVLTPVTAAVLGAVAWVLVGRTLRPVEAIRREVADIAGDQPDRRVPEPGTGDEIDRLASTMNGMLERIAAHVERQQRFVADASHELRSPLARIRTQIEVDRAYPERSDPDATLASVLEETLRLQQLLDDLLTLARTDEGVGPPPTVVDLDDVVLEEAARARTGDGVRVDLSGVSAAQVLGDRRSLARLVRNLLDNATRHAASTVTLEVREVGADAVVTVTDDGPGIPAGERERVMERFARLDDARTPGRAGAGLGLAIALAVAVGHRGSLVVDPDHHPGTRMVLTLPLAPVEGAVAARPAQPRRGVLSGRPKR